MKNESNQIWEYRIKYNAGACNSAMNSFHYYSAKSAFDALKYHNLMMEKHSFTSQTLSVERRCPYAKKWIDETEDAYLNSEETNND